MKRDFSPKTLAVMLILLGLLSGTMAGVTLSRQNSYSPAKAEITRIDTEYSFAEERYDHTVYVKYSVEGQDYEEQLGYYDDSLKEGKVIDIFYNPDNPSQIVEGSKLFSTILLVAGPAMVVAGAVILVKQRR